jgi:hypothetical protein
LRCQRLLNSIRQWKNLRRLKELFQEPSIIIIQTVITEHFNVADDRDGWSVLLNELPQSSVLRLRGVDDDIAIKKH